MNVKSHMKRSSQPNLLRGLVQPEMIILSSFTRPHVTQTHVTLFLSFEEHWNIGLSLYRHKNTEAFLKISSFVLSRKAIYTTGQNFFLQEIITFIHQGH